MRIRAPHGSLDAWLLTVAFGCAPSPPDSGRDGNTAALRAGATVSAATVGPEFDFGQPLQDDQTAPELEQAVASNAAGVSLVVWSVGRTAPLSPYFAGASDIYAARVAPDGTILDPAGIPIATARLGEVAPAVASDGSGWFVTWQGQQGYYSSGILGARVTSDAKVLDSIVISATSGDKTNRAVAYDGTNFLVSWTSGFLGNSGRDVCVARVGADGTLLDATELVVAHAYDVSESPGVDVASDGSNWLVVWHSNSSTQFPATMDPTANVLGAHVSPAGEVVDFIPISDDTGDQLDPDVSCQDGTCFVAWEDQSTSIVGASVTGTTVHDDVVVGTSSSGEPLRAPVVVWDGANWVTGWLRGNTGQDAVEAARVTSTGTVVDSTTVPLASDAGGVALTRSSSRVLVTWAGPPDPTRYPGYGYTYTYASFLSDGEPTSSFVVSRALVDTPGYGPAAAVSANNWLLVWGDRRTQESSNPSSAAYGTRVSPTGTILDPQGIRISPAGANVGSIALDSDGKNSFVIWAEDGPAPDGTSIRGVRVAADGGLLDSEPRVVVPNAQLQNLSQSFPRIAFNGASWLVTAGNGSATRVAVDGSVLDPSGIPIGVPMDQPAALAGGEGQWLAVNALRNAQSSWDIVGQRIANDGTLVDAQPFSIAPHVNSSSNMPSPSVAYGAGKWLVVWQSPPNPNRNDVANLLGVRVDASGNVLDSEPITIFTPTAAGFVRPAVAFDGSTWLAAWIDTREWSLVRLADTPVDVYATRVNDAGQPLDAAFRVTSNVYSGTFGGLAAGPQRWLTLYTKTAGPDEGLRATIVLDGCIPTASTDTTCDGVDDDCDGTPDDEFSPTPTTCGVGSCAAAGMTSCVNGHVVDSCLADPTDSDRDGVPNCADACPLVPGTRSDGCPETGEGGAGGQGGEEPGGAAGSAAGGAAASGAGGAVSGTGNAGTSGTAGKAGTGGTSGHAGTPETGGEAGEAGSGAAPSGGSGQGGHSGGRGGGAGQAGSTSGHAGTESGQPSSGSSCSCRLPARQASTPWGLALGLVGTSVALRRRRRTAR